jgi:hypothetical protein
MSNQDSVYEHIARHAEAKVRVAAYIAQHEKMLGLDPAVIHNLNGGTEMGGLSLLTEDLKVLVGWVP